ncbi:MAG: VOC family protein [Candidatus Wenzhouxiangella sp. M2_3B_020]
MARVTGLGGVFFKCDDMDATREWYAGHLGVPFNDWGGWSLHWRYLEDPEHVGRTEWSPFPADTEYMQPSGQPFMMNFRVDDLDAMIEQLRRAGIELIGEPEEHEYGKFAWILDPNGVKIELWEPAGEEGSPRSSHLG